MLQAVKTAQNRQITDFEALPRLQRHPMYGDVLAYRLLEIAANFTPQVSQHRLSHASAPADVGHCWRVDLEGRGRGWCRALEAPQRCCRSSLAL